MLQFLRGGLKLGQTKEKERDMYSLIRCGAIANMCKYRGVHLLVIRTLEF